VNIKISIHGISGRTLSAWNPGRAFTLSKYTAGANKSTWQVELKLSELDVNKDEFIYDAD